MKKEAVKNLKGQMSFDLPLGFKVGNKHERAITLLRGNGVSEEVVLKKNGEKPYTWIGNVIAISTECLGEHKIGAEVREDYAKNGQVSIPMLVEMFPLADANSMLLEIHRRIWQPVVRNQTIMCQVCTKTFPCTIDLNRIDMDEESKKLLDSPTPLDTLITELEIGFNIDNWLRKIKKDEEKADLMGHTYNRLVFRIPTLGDAIKNEKLSTTDNVRFWRMVALDCLKGIEAVVDGKVVAEIPSSMFIWMNTLPFDEWMDTEDLKSVRKTIREDVPTMPFDYKDVCPCDRQKEIPYSMQASAFFSE